MPEVQSETHYVFRHSIGKLLFQLRVSVLSGPVFISFITVKCLLLKLYKLTCFQPSLQVIMEKGYVCYDRNSQLAH